MTYLYKALLMLHILAGFLALIAGFISMLTEKGKRLHRRTGLVFYYSMLLVSASSILMAVIKPNSFLLMIGIFSLYLNYSGFRSVNNKSLKPGLLDWMISLIASINAFMMISSMQLVLLVFASISIILLLNDCRIYYLLNTKKEISQLSWLKRHIGMMTGAFISTATAFLVVNVKNIDPAWLSWLLPSMIGAPLIVYWTRRYTSKPKKLISL